MDVHPTRVTLLEQTSFNRFARIDTPNETFALRIASDVRVHHDATESVEGAWLAHLANDGWPVPTMCAPPADLDDRRYTLFTWIDGTPLRDALADSEHDTLDQAPERLGKLMAGLHESASNMASLPAQDLMAFDQVLYLPERDLLSSDDEMCAQAIVQVQATIDQLWHSRPHPPHLLHGDIGSHNAMVIADAIVPIDFQDLRYGFDRQDIGITLADFDRGRPGWAERFLEGYATVRNVPDLSTDDRDAFRAARSLNMLNLGLHVRKPGFDEFWERHTTIVRSSMS